MGETLGALFANKLVERLTKSTKNALPVYLEFGHDTSIDMALTGLGLAKDESPLQPQKPIPADRKWRTSRQVMFAAQMIWEKFTCSSSFKGPQVRLVLNDSPFPLTICSDMDKTYGSCALGDFVLANKASQAISWRDAAWNATCGA